MTDELDHVPEAVDELSQITETIALLKTRNERVPFTEVAPKLIGDLVRPRVRKAVEDITQLADRVGSDLAGVGRLPVFVDKRWGGWPKEFY